jgi:hypothetical protein
MIDLERLLERRRVSVEQFLVENSIKTAAEFSNFLVAANMFATISLTTKVLGALTEQQPPQEKLSQELEDQPVAAPKKMVTSKKKNSDG